MRKALLLSAALSLAVTPARAVQHGTGDASSGSCTEMFHDCLRGCGSPGSNPNCERYCEEQVLARCKAGAAAKGSAIKPGAVKPGLKAAPAQ